MKELSKGLRQQQQQQVSKGQLAPMLAHCPPWVPHPVATMKDGSGGFSSSMAAEDHGRVAGGGGSSHCDPVSHCSSSMQTNHGKEIVVSSPPGLPN